MLIREAVVVHHHFGVAGKQSHQQSTFKSVQCSCSVGSLGRFSTSKLAGSANKKCVRIFLAVRVCRLVKCSLVVGIVVNPDSRETGPDWNRIVRFCIFFREGEGNLSKKIGRCQKCAKFQLDVVAAIEGNYCAFLDRTGSRSLKSVLREEDSPCKSW